MKIQITIRAVLETEDILSNGIKYAIEKSVFNQEKDSLANLWACDEIDRQGVHKQITLLELR